MRDSIVTQIWRRRELLKSLVIRNLKIRYKGSTLGFFWSLMDPLLMVLVYFVFVKLTRFQVDIPYLISGVFAWQFLTLCVGDSFHAVIGNTSLVKKVYFPRLILPLSTGIANFVNFLLSLVVLIVFLLLFGVKIKTLALAYLPLFVLLEFLLCQGLALLFSSVMVYFRDTQHLVGIGLMAWFFLSPVIYPIHLVPEKWLGFYQANPMCTILMGFRSSLLGQPFTWGGFTGLASVLCGLVFLFGLWVFVKLEPYFADEL